MVLRRAARDTLPVLAGYVVLGIGFGMVLRAKGFGIQWAFWMSAGIYAGAMQFAALELFSSGASLAAIALTTLAVNARHLFYGLSMLEKYRGAGAKKPYLIFSLTDETFSLVSAQPPIPWKSREEEQKYCLWVSILDHVYWTGGSVLGALLGGVLGTHTEGLEFALTALFLTIFTDQWRSSKKRWPALAGLGCALICLLAFGRENFLLPALAAVAAVLLVGDRLEVRHGK